MSKVLIIGDTHGQFGRLNKLLNKYKPDIAIITGDFGFWPKFFNKEYIDSNRRIRMWDAEIKNGSCKVYFCDGNHEDHDALDELTNHEIMPNVFYMKRGSILNIHGQNILFVGGALSIDKNYRTPKYDWFEQEILKEEDLLSIPNDVQIDMVISHTAPSEFKFDTDKFLPDPSRDVLSKVLDKYKPREWYFGHFHKYREGKYKDCKWTMIADIESYLQSFVIKNM